MVRRSAPTTSNPGPTRTENGASPTTTTTGFTAVTPQRAVQIMKAWAYHPWPITFDEGIRIYTSLGFKGDPDKSQFFTSDSSPTETDSFYYGDENTIDGVRMRLSNFVPKNDWANSLPKSRLAFQDYIDAYTRTLGAPITEKDNGTDFSTRWILNGSIAVMIGGNEAFINLIVESPQQTKHLLDELEAKANGEEIGADYF